MEFRPATQEDLDYVKSCPFEQPVKNYPYLECPDDNTITAIFQGKIAAVAGVIILWEGVGLFWIILTENCKKEGCFGILAVSAIRDKFNELIEKNNLWRAQATVRTDFAVAVKMIKFLGFECEGIMKKYLPDKSDAFIFGKIIER